MLGGRGGSQFLPHRDTALEHRLQLRPSFAQSLFYRIAIVCDDGGCRFARSLACKFELAAISDAGEPANSPKPCMTARDLARGPD